MNVRLWMILTLAIAAMSLYVLRSRCGHWVAPVRNAENISGRLYDTNEPQKQHAYAELLTFERALRPVVAPAFEDDAIRATADNALQWVNASFERVKRVWNWDVDDSARTRDQAFVHACELRTHWTTQDCLQLLHNSAAIRCDTDLRACVKTRWYAQRTTQEWRATLQKHLEGLCPRSLPAKGACLLVSHTCETDVETAYNIAEAIALRTLVVETTHDTLHWFANTLEELERALEAGSRL